MVELLNVDFTHKDERGKLTQLVHDGFKQINVLESNAGTVRGGHYHKKVTEAFYIVRGSVKLIAKKGMNHEEYFYRVGDFFLVKPYIVHSMEFPEDCIMVQMYTECVEMDNGEKDIFPE